MHRRRWMIAALAVGGVLFFWAGRWIVQAAVQLLWGMLAAMTALPAARRLEKHMPPGPAAALALGMVTMVLAAGVLLMVPPLAAQGKQLASLLPRLGETVNGAMQRTQGWLQAHQLSLGHGMQQAIISRGQQALASGAAAMASHLGVAAGNAGKWLITPVLAFYFLRDRRQIGEWLKSLLPLSAREPAVWMAREIRRETAGYLRGQLMVSAAVAAATALGLLACGVPAWLVLGLVMGVMEWIPYLGPLLGGIAVAMFALPGGWMRTLWAMGVVLAVQQMEGSLLSPRLMSTATRLHPLAVVLCVMFGGAAAGITGAVLCVPLLLCARAVLRVISLLRIEQKRV